MVGVVNYQGQILVGRKKEDHSNMSGLWHLPGGKLESEESAISALEREILEEAGVPVHVRQHVGYHTSRKHKHVLWYHCDALSADIRAGDDLDAVEWLSPSLVPARCSEVYDLWPETVKDYFSQFCRKEWP